MESSHPPFPSDQQGLVALFVLSALSVISSILSTILAMILGFKMLMLVAVLVYAAGVASLLRLPLRARGRTS